MRRGMEWTPIYLMIILVIAAILIFAIVKPMFQNAAEYAKTLSPSFLFF
jgi:Tfp pilus assembly protein PilE